MLQLLRYNHSYIFRLVGALLTLSPEYCFVAEDDSGVCAYLVAALDAKKFWAKYEIAYLPEMREKYEKPNAEEDKEMTEAEVCVELLEIRAQYK